MPTRRVADEPSDGWVGVLRLVELVTEAGRVTTGEWSCGQAVSDHTEQYGETDHTDHLIDRTHYVVEVLQSDERKHY